MFWKLIKGHSIPPITALPKQDNCSILDITTIGIVNEWIIVWAKTSLFERYDLIIFKYDLLGRRQPSYENFPEKLFSQIVFMHWSVITCCSDCNYHTKKNEPAGFTLVQYNNLYIRTLNRRIYFDNKFSLYCVRQVCSYNSWI